MDTSMDARIGRIKVYHIAHALLACLSIIRKEATSIYFVKLPLKSQTYSF